MVSHIFEPATLRAGVPRSTEPSVPPSGSDVPVGSDAVAHIFESDAPGQSARPKNACVRCSKKFKGDWDQLETAEGAICYICSNQGAEGTPERLKPEHVKTVAPVVPPGKEAPNLEPPTAPPTFLGFETESPKFKRVVLIGGLSVIGLTFILVMFGGLEVPMDDARMEEALEIEVHPALSVVLTIWGYVLVFLSGLVAVYIFQRGTDKLDQNVLWMDLLQTSWPILQLTVIHFGLLFLAGIIGVLPLAGAIFATLLALARLLIAYFVCSKYFDFFLGEFVVVFILYKVISIVLTAVSYGFFGTITNLFM